MKILKTEIKKSYTGQMLKVEILNAADYQNQFIDAICLVKKQNPSLKLDYICARYTCDDIYVLSFYHQGKINLERKYPGMARANFKAFLRLWPHADQDLKEVKDAKLQLQKL